jgi:hypothetical protein
MPHEQSNTRARLYETIIGGGTPERARKLWNARLTSRVPEIS